MDASDEKQNAVDFPHDLNECDAIEKLGGQVS